jgi:hypothetical protein
MLNLLRFRPDGGRARYLEYVEHFRRTAAPHGAEVLFVGDGSTALVAEPGQSWTRCCSCATRAARRSATWSATRRTGRGTHLRTDALEEAVLQATVPVGGARVADHGVGTSAVKTAVVLAAGGVVGQAFHLGVLGCLAEAVGFDARRADVLVGSSAGSLVAAGLAGGLSAADLRAEMLGEPLSRRAAHPRVAPRDAAHARRRAGADRRGPARRGRAAARRPPARGPSGPAPSPAACCRPGRSAPT